MSDEPTETVLVEPIWQGTVDHDKFTVKVCPEEDPMKGQLIVVLNETEEELLSEPVDFTYPPIFGPDVSDVDAWARRSMERIDQWYRDNGQEPPAEVPD